MKEAAKSLIRIIKQIVNTEESYDVASKRLIEIDNVLNSEDKKGQNYELQLAEIGKKLKKEVSGIERKIGGEALESLNEIARGPIIEKKISFKKDMQKSAESVECKKTI